MSADEVLCNPGCLLLSLQEHCCPLKYCHAVSFIFLQCFLRILITGATVYAQRSLINVASHYGLDVQASCPDNVFYCGLWPATRAGSLVIWVLRSWLSARLEVYCCFSSYLAVKYIYFLT